MTTYTIPTTNNASVDYFAGYLQDKIKEHIELEGKDRFRFIVNYKNFTLSDYKKLKDAVDTYGWQIDKKLKNKRKEAEYHVYRIPKNLTYIQKQIDACNDGRGCNFFCSRDKQWNCILLKMHQERIDYCKAMGISIEYW